MCSIFITSSTLPFSRTHAHDGWVGVQNPVMRRDKITFDLSRDGRSRRERSIQRINAMNRMLRSRYATLQNPHVRLFSCPLLFPRFSRSPCSHGSLCTLRFFPFSVIFMFPVLSFSMFSWFSLYSQILPFLRDLRVPCSLVLHVLMVLSVLSDSSLSP